MFSAGSLAVFSASFRNGQGMQEMTVDHDLLLIVGLVLLCLSLISLLAAHVEGRLPVVAGIVLAMGTGLAAWGVIGTGRDLSPLDLPYLFFDVLGRYLP